MPDLIHTIQGNDLSFLKMVANTWGLELTAPDVHTAIPFLLSSLLNRSLVQEVVDALPQTARSALAALVEGDGMMPWSIFCRKYGEVRVMGAARRDRERPDLRPASPAEVLWYRALIGRAFLRPGGEPQEYAYIPEDLLALFGPLGASGEIPLGRPATPVETAVLTPANDRILDDACTLLAALRLGLSGDVLAEGMGKIPLMFLEQVLRDAGLLDANRMPVPEAARAFLEAPRAKALAQLASAWLHSRTCNDLRMLPGLVFEGEWKNDPLSARQAVLDLMSRLPQSGWWNLASFVSGVHDQHPDFQRSAGEYDSWFIRVENSERYLSGFGAWDEVEGALVRWLICGPMHWLGMIDLGTAEDGEDWAAFRTSVWAVDLWHDQPPEGLEEEKETLRITSDNSLEVPRLVPRALRYQIARFCAWRGRQSNQGYVYQLTPPALERARQQGLKPAQLLTLLRRHLGAGFPPRVAQAVERWEKDSTQAEMEEIQVLRLQTPEAVNALRSSKAARFLGEVLNPTTIVLRPGGREPVLRALADAGFLVDDRLPGEKS